MARLVWVAPDPNLRMSSRCGRHVRRRIFLGMFKRIVIAGIILVAIGSIAGVALAASGGHADLAPVRKATDRFHDLAVAQSSGYGLLADAKGVICIDMPGIGTMGVHYANNALVGAGKIDANAPQALVYAPQASGQPKLVALEYVVLQDAWDAQHTSAPALFGHTFDLTSSPNRFGLPAYYSLHAWVWKDNPAGTFTMWNPNVSCTP